MDVRSTGTDLGPGQRRRITPASRTDRRGWLIDGQDRTDVDGCLGGPVEPVNPAAHDQDDHQQRDQQAAPTPTSRRGSGGYY